MEAIANRVKKSLLLHWLTCGIYSTGRSGGTQGFWKGVRDNLAGMLGSPEAAPRKRELPILILLLLAVAFYYESGG